jgi:uncharacterized protein (UPF0548 family)
MLTFRRPSADRIRTFLEEQRPLPYTYEDVGASLLGSPDGFDRDHNRQHLGHGKAAFDAGCAAIRAWTPFPRPLASTEPPGLPIEKDTMVGVLIRAFGLWWLNSARIVYIIDEPRRFGFAYGTLPGHAECGEERFLVEWLEDDSVWYDLAAFSKPRWWPAKIGKPLVRRLQFKFHRGSKAAMRAAVAGDES